MGLLQDSGGHAVSWTPNKSCAAFFAKNGSPTVNETPKGQEDAKGTEIATCLFLYFGQKRVVEVHKKHKCLRLSWTLVGWFRAGKAAEEKQNCLYPLQGNDG